VREDRGPVTELRLNRPDRRNALTTDLLLDLRDHLQEIRDDPLVRVVLLTGAGEAFCAGADLNELSGSPAPQAGLRRIRLVTEVLGRITGLEQVSVAAVHGAAVGAGWGLALACDLCFASSTAHFRLPEVSKGLRIPELLMHRLIQVVGPVRAAELAIAGTAYDAPSALAAGCVSRVIDDREALHAEAWSFCAEVAAHPRRSVMTAKSPLRATAPRLPFPPSDLIWNEE
jgi:enoyl-CoA hydratase/carnithine racemase